MLAQTGYAAFDPAEIALSHPRTAKVLARLPYRQLHTSLIAASRIEAWLRWPVLTLEASDRIRDKLSEVDPDGRRFGLTDDIRRRYRDATLYQGVPDLFVLLSKLDDRAFRREALLVENEAALARAKDAGPGAIVVGFRLGPHAALPYVLGALGHDVSMIVSSRRLADASTRIGEHLAPRASRRVRFMDATDSLVLARAREDLDEGRVVSTLMEFAGEFQKTLPVRFLGWDVQVPYGIPYLAAMSGRPVIPATLRRGKGPRYKLTFSEPIPAPGRDRVSIQAATQALYSELERQVLRTPSQWVGWTLLEQHMGIDLNQPRSLEAVGQS
jgi:hypothetical protein